MQKKNLLQIILAVAAALLSWHFVEADDSARTGIAIFVLIAWLWISEAMHISATALLIPVVAVLTGVFEVAQAFSAFANPVLFLFMGGFALAAGLQKHELDKAFAARVLSLSGGRPLASILLLFLCTAVLSMWISNTAAVAMMLPLALSLLSSRDSKKEVHLYLFVLLGLAYSGNLGGLATLIGSPPNAIAASVAGLDFRQWLNFGIPMFAVLFPIMIGVLYALFRPDLGEALTLDYDKPPAHWRRTLMMIIFFLTALAWVFSSPLSNILGINSGFDALVAVAAIVFLTGSGSLEFNEFVNKTNWPILLLFGGGLTLSAILQSSGASSWLAQIITEQLPSNNNWLLLLMVCFFVIFLTELVSNTASAALLVPLFMTVAVNLNLSPVIMAVLIAFCASCAFMLPVATPPNALVFSSGFVPQRQMMRAGLMLNVLMALVLATLAWVMMR